MIVSDEAFAYLVHQVGDIHDLKDDRAGWETAYENKLNDQYENIKSYLPNARSDMQMVDVGGGMGGIDIVIARNLSPAMGVWLLDGVGDAPEMLKHDRTHSSINVARRFMRSNNFMGGIYSGVPWKCDLVVSFAAWCFHFSPSAYLDLIVRRCISGAVIILDVRRGRYDWEQALNDRFNFQRVISEQPKFRRMVFTSRG